MGNTTWGIAQKHNTTVKQILKDNDLAKGGALIHINDKLKIRVDDSLNKDRNNSTISTQIESQKIIPAYHTIVYLQLIKQPWLPIKYHHGLFHIHQPINQMN